MNIELNENISFELIISELCDQKENNTHVLKEKYGNGIIQTLIGNSNINLIYLDIRLEIPLLVDWQYSSEFVSDLYLMINLTDERGKLNEIESRSMEKNSALFSPNISRKILWLPGYRYRLLFCRINSEWLIKSLEYFSFNPSIQDFFRNNKQVYLNNFNNTRLITTTKQLLFSSNIKQESNSFYEIKIIELLYLFLDSIFSSISTQKKDHNIHPDDQNKINDFIIKLYNHIDNIPSISVASSELDMSESKFQRIFKRATLTTYHSYVLEIKMEKAMELLMKGMSVSEVSIETGYSSISNFSLAFKKYFSLLPSEV